jgi:hypothetical protein
MQDRVHLVLDPRAMSNDLIPTPSQPALALGGGVWRPNLEQEAGREQARQRAGVDVVGLHMRVRDRLH